MPTARRSGSDDVAFFRVDQASTRGSYLPIGTPTDNNRLYVLDDGLQLVPLGAVGELCGGNRRRPGYISDSLRTASVFVPNPFGAPGERLYRTGDSARRRRDGVLEYGAYRSSSEDLRLPHRAGGN